jgi:hypothetical protein
MKTLKTFESFVLNEKKKNYTEADHKKDKMRIADIQTKAEKKAEKNGTSVEEEMCKLAQTQANRIGSYDKAFYRGKAADEAGLQDIAEIFWKRADELEDDLVNESSEMWNSSQDSFKSRWDSDDDNDDEGGLVLTIEGEKYPSKWFYIHDAIMNGILEDYCQISSIDHEIIDEYGVWYAEQMGDNDDYMDIDTMTEMILQDFDVELGMLFQFLEEKEYIDRTPLSVTIEGEDEDGEEFELYYEK